MNCEHEDVEAFLGSIRRSLHMLQDLADFTTDSKTLPMDEKLKTLEGLARQGLAREQTLALLMLGERLSKRINETNEVLHRIASVMEKEVNGG